MLYENFVNAYEKTFEKCSLAIWRILINTLDLQPGSYLLDAGCGNGMLAEMLQNHSLKIAGIDLSSSMIARAHSKNLKETEFIKGDALSLPFMENTFDTYIGSLLINNVKNPSTLIQEAFRVLKPEGKIAITYPIFQSKNDIIKVMKSALRAVKIGSKNQKAHNYLQYIGSDHFSYIQTSIVPIELKLSSGAEVCEFLSPLKDIKQLEKIHKKEEVFRIITEKVDSILGEGKCLIFEVCIITAQKITETLK